jgi:hypothetical protein
VKRRNILLGGLGVVVVAGLGVIGFGRGAAEDKIVSLLRQRLSFLKLDEAGLHAFAHDHVGFLLAKRPTWTKWKYHFLQIFSKSVTRWNSSSDTRTRTERTVDHMASTYLLSTNFFTVNKGDTSQLVRYIALYDPMRPCGNPFARSPLPATAESEPAAKS